MKRLATGLGIALISLLAAAPSAWAVQITVNSNEDDLVDDSTCTLREAITAANNDLPSDDATNGCPAGDGADEIVFTDPPFNGGAMMTVPQSTIVTSGLPDITEELTITGDGPTCINALNKPCVGITVSPGGLNEALKVTGGVPLTVTGVTVTGASVGIDAEDGILTVSRLWVGLTLDQSVPLGNTTGILLGDDAIVGNQVAGERNLFAANTIGVYVLGGNNNSIRGSDFGIRPTGTTTGAYANGTSIRIVDDETATDPATNNTVGNPENGTTGICDGGCNVLANANGDGLDLSGIAAGEDPATGPTDVIGNNIGLTGFTAGALSNDDDGIDVGAADSVTVGGFSALDRNYIGGNGVNGVKHEIGGEDFEFRNNYVGLNGAATAEIPDTVRGLSSMQDGAVVRDNRFGGSPVLIAGTGSMVKRNVFGIGLGGEDVGINGDSLVVSGADSVVGGSAMGEANTIGNTGGLSNSAISVEANGVQVQGNLVGVDAGGQAHPNDGHGVTVGPSGAVDNVVIGGSGAGQGNVISNSGGDAIRVPGATSNNDVIRANTGRANGSSANDLFVDLGLEGPGNATTNTAIQPPAITSATATQVQGTSAEVNGTVIDIYRTITDRGDVHSHLGETTVTAGAWSFTYLAPLGTGVCVAATQTEQSAPKGSSEPSATTTIGGGVCDVTGPTSTIDSGPEELPPTRDTTPTFGFSASELGSTFECSVDGGGFSGCPSPFTTPVLTEGDHTLQVRATDPADNLGAPSTIRNFGVDTTAPDTTVTRFRKRPRRRRAIVIFTSSDPTATFQCKLNGRGFSPCATPTTYRRLKRGRRHTIQVRALDAAGNVDATPTTNRIRIPRRRR